MKQFFSAALVLVLTALSGIMDARGFVYAARAWPSGHFDLKFGLASILSFVAGLSLYIASVRFMQAFGLGAVAIQSAIWFVITAIGIGLMDGSVAQWSRAQQLVAVAVFVGLGFLIVTTRAAEG
jgi:hypothetical protein